MSYKVIPILMATLSLMGCPSTDGPDKADDGFMPFNPDMMADMAGDASSDQAGDISGDLSDDMGDMSADATPDMNVDMDMMMDMPSGICQPNTDGVITRAEVPLRAGLKATYKVALDAPVNTAGTDGGDDRKLWDLSGSIDGDQNILIEATEPTGRWFSPDFLNASYVTRLSQGSDLLGVFQITDEALLLLGVVSPEDGFTRTKLTYDPPVKVLQFPIQLNSSWQTEADVSGTANGVVSVYDEDYISQVDAIGTLKTPYGTFDEVLRVRTELTRTVGFFTTTIRTYLFVSECFGTVATIVSEDDESDIEFTTAAEVRRLSL